MPHSEDVEIRFELQQGSVERVLATIECMERSLERVRKLQETVLENAEKLATMGGFGGFSGHD